MPYYGQIYDDHKSQNKSNITVDSSDSAQNLPNDTTISH